MLEPIFAFLFVIGILIFFHELGHFLAAKWRGIRVEAFSLGFGPSIVCVRRGETDYKLSWIPFGGYVKMAGENPDDEDDQDYDEPWRFHNKSIPSRMCVILAGPFANIVLSVIVYTIIFSVYGINWVDTTRIGQVVSGTAAEEAGLLPGDRVTEINGVGVTNWIELVERVQETPGESVRVDFVREGVERNATLRVEPNEFTGIVPQYDTRVGEAIEGGPAEAAGIVRGDRILTIDGTDVRYWRDLRPLLEGASDREILIRFERGNEIHEVSVVPQSEEEVGPTGETRVVGKLFITEYQEKRRLGLLESIRESFTQTWFVIRSVSDFLVMLFSGGVSRDMVGGPISIYQLSGESAKRGFDMLLLLIAFLSPQLGVLNLLPIPILDGGHMLFLTIEAIRRRPLSMKLRLVLQQAGLLLILGLMATVTFLDLGKLFR